MGPVKWVVNAAMVLVLFAGVTFAVTVFNAHKVMPTKLEDLTVLHLTIKDADIGEEEQTFHSTEYFTTLKSTHKIKNWTALKASLVRPGDQVDVYLGSFDASLLALAPTTGKAPTGDAHVRFYGLAKSSGEMIVDPEETLAENAGIGALSDGFAHEAFLMIFIPLAYFFVMGTAFLYKRRELKKPKA